MKLKSRILPIVAGALVLWAIAYWIRLLVAARYTSTHNIGSSSQFGAFHCLLIGSLCVAAFLAGALSFWRHPASALILRVIMGVFSSVGVFMVARGLVQLFSTPGSFRDSSLRPIPITSGLILLCAYFVISWATSFPLISVRHVFRVGLVLHYGILPVSLALIFLFGMPQEHYVQFQFFGFYLVAGLAFALLSFRMYELRQTFNRHS